MKVNPCLFIGLGTNGVNILQELRKLFYEEFGVGGLPCFRYVGIETDRDNKPREVLPHRAEDYEKIKMIPITIPALSAVQITPALDAWLDRRTLNANEGGFQRGAGHRRQAGRLCLWENWASVSQELIGAVGAISLVGNLADTNHWLRNNYFARRQPGIRLPGGSLVNSVPRVYIFGTLCGGTCSGTFLDIAYFLHTQLLVRTRAQLRDVGISEIIGLFTIPDTRTMAIGKHVPHVASSWAALTELDFYSREDTIYEVTFPGGLRIPPTREPPFTTVYLESKVNTGNVGFPAEDMDALPQMCAMNLFTEVVAGLAEPKAANRVNLPAAGTGYFQTNAKGYFQGFSSFGLSAIWYPRYRIAKAISFRLSEEMSKHWLGPQEPSIGKIEEVVKADWQASVAKATASLVGSAGPGAHCTIALEATITEMFNRRRAEFKERGPDELEEFVANFPGQDSTFGQKLNPAGEYYRLVAYAEPLVARDLKQDLGRKASQYLKEHTFRETTVYLRGLLTTAESSVKSGPQILPAFSQKIDLSFSTQVYEDRCAWILGLRKRAIAEYQTAKWDEFKQHVMNHVKRIQDYFLRRIFESILEDLRRLLNQIEQAEATLKAVRGRCIEECEKLIQFKVASNIVLISVGDPDKIDDDVALGAAEILTSESPERLRARFLGDEDPIALLRDDPFVLMTMLDLRFEDLIQPIVTRFQIEQEALNGMEDRMKDLVHSSAPYFEPTINWDPSKMTPPQLPNFIFCNDETARPRLAALAGAYLLGTGYDPRFSPLDHFVFFYQETPGLAINDLRFSVFASEKLDELERAEGGTEPTRYTHKFGRRMFDPAAIFETAQQWIRDTRALGPEFFKQLQADFFLEYRGADGTMGDLLVTQEQSVREYLKNFGLENLIRLLAKNLAAIGRDELVKRMDARRAKAQTAAERESLRRTHGEIMKIVFPVIAGSP